MKSMMSSQSGHSRFFYSCKNSPLGYKGKFQLRKHCTTIQFEVCSEFLYTSQLSATVKVLEEQLPSIFCCQCFNDDNIPFTKEVENTELGHLFEHILLEFLCKEKLHLGENSADYSGVTNWNWKRDPRGTFRININIGKEESHIFASALQHTVALVNQIIEESELEYSLTPAPSSLIPTTSSLQLAPVIVPH